MDVYKLALLTALVYISSTCQASERNRKTNCWLPTYCPEESKHEVNVHPTNATVAEGCQATLSCIFKKKFPKCAWYRNGDVLAIKARYRYANAETNGLNTEDCSLIIEEFTKIDVAEWSCSSHHDSEHCPCTKSNKAYLKMEATKENATAKPCWNLYSNDQLQCKILLLVGNIAFVLMILALIIICCQRRNGRKANQNQKWCCSTVIIAPSCCGNCRAKQCDQRTIACQINNSNELTKL